MRVNALPLELLAGSLSEVVTIGIFLFSGKLDRPGTVKQRQETVRVGCCSLAHNYALYRQSYLRVVLLQLFAVSRRHRLTDPGSGCVEGMAA